MTNDVLMPLILESGSKYPGKASRMPGDGRVVNPAVATDHRKTTRDTAARTMAIIRDYLPI